MMYSADQEATFGWDLEDYTEPPCPACGDHIDCCQGHGGMDDPQGHLILEAHDNDDHIGCHPASACRTVSRPRL